MRFTLLLASVSIFALGVATPAHAEIIRVKQDDGTIVEVEMGAPEQPADEAAPPAEEPAPAPRPQAAAPKPQNGGLVPTEEPTFQPQVKATSLRDALGRPVKDQPAAPAPAAAAAPEPAPAPREASPAPKPEPKATKKSKSKKSKPVEEAPQAAPAEGHVEHVIPPGAAVTQEVATSIALDAAPASSGYTVVTRSYDGRNIYVVTFNTEEGPYDVLVDSSSGTVLRKGYVTVEAPPTLPGHLPAPGVVRPLEPLPPEAVPAPAKTAKKKAAKKKKAKPKPKPEAEVKVKVEAKPVEQAPPVVAPPAPATAVPAGPPAPAPVAPIPAPLPAPVAPPAAAPPAPPPIVH